MKLFTETFFKYCAKWKSVN